VIRWSTEIGRLMSSLRTHAALGLRPAFAPVIVFVPLGALLGPAGSGVLSARTIDALDTVISIALATLAVFVGIAAGRVRRDAWRLMAASTAEGMLTALVVAGACVLLLPVWGMPLETPYGIVAAALGVAAAASAAPFVSEADDELRRSAARVADLDDVLPIMLGAVVVSLAVSSGGYIVRDVLTTVAVGVAVGIAGWLLLERAEGAERGVFVIGTLALLGGCTAYLRTSPLLAGLVAGFLWARMPGRTDHIAADDLRTAEHPLVVLLLIAAGAGLEPSLLGVWLLAPYVLFRTAGKSMGGWVAARLAPGLTPPDLGAYLLSPGVLGIAFILNLQQVAGEAVAPLVFAVTVGAVISELLGVVLTPEPRA
jgi:hypothetical protein